MQWEQWRNNSDALVAGPIPAGEYTTLPVALQPSDVALQGSFTDIPSLLKLNILEEFSSSTKGLIFYLRWMLSDCCWHSSVKWACSWGCGRVSYLARAHCVCLRHTHGLALSTWSLLLFLFQA